MVCCVGWAWRGARVRVRVRLRDGSIESTATGRMSVCGGSTDWTGLDRETSPGSSCGAVEGPGQGSAVAVACVCGAVLLGRRRGLCDGIGMAFFFGFDSTSSRFFVASMGQRKAAASTTEARDRRGRPKGLDGIDRSTPRACVMCCVGARGRGALLGQGLCGWV